MYLITSRFSNGFHFCWKVWIFPLMQYSSFSRVTTSDIRDLNMGTVEESTQTHFIMAVFLASIKSHWITSSCRFRLLETLPCKHGSGFADTRCPVAVLVFALCLPELYCIPTGNATFYIWNTLVKLLLCLYYKCMAIYRYFVAYYFVIPLHLLHYLLQIEILEV